MTRTDTDSQQHLEWVALVAVKEAAVREMNHDLVDALIHLIQCNKVDETREYRVRNQDLRANILDLRAEIEDTLLSIRLVENELHDMQAPGW